MRQGVKSWDFVASKPVRLVILWQAVISLAAAFLAWIWTGLNGAASALLGGWVNMSAFIAFALVASFSAANSSSGTIRVLIRAEAVKVTLILLQLWWVITAFRGLVPLIFISTFVITALATRMAFHVQAE
jgi:F0F1-type ATP synthase assembly protein I